MLKTPEYDLKSFVDVYEPSEDSFLFIDALEQEIGFLQTLKPGFIAEVGCGSGVITSALSQVITNCVFHATDVNIKACEATVVTGSLNGACIDPVCMDLLRGFRANLFDVILFNPPYVVTGSEELAGYGLNRAWAGGVDGREIIDAFLPTVVNNLTANGVLYLLLLKENKPQEVIETLFRMGFVHAILKERKILGEYLYIIKFTRGNKVI